MARVTSVMNKLRTCNHGERRGVRGFFMRPDCTMVARAVAIYELCVVDGED